MDRKESSELAIISLPISYLRSNPNNARTHSKHQVRQIADSITAFGFTNPILMDRSNMVIAGHGRVEAAKLLGIEKVPTICLEHLTEDQLQAYIIADNRLAERAGWDREILAVEFQHLLAIDGLDITITGFEIPEIDLILEDAKTATSSEEAPLVPDFNRDPVSKLSDLWKLGKHRIFCGNALHDESFRVMMGTCRASIVFSDPPFNVPIDGHVTGKGSIHHREFQMASGEMTEAEFTAFLDSSLRLLSRFSVKGSVHYVCIDWRHVGELLAASKSNYDELLNICVWVKNVGGMGSFYRSQHELIFVFRNGKDRHRNNVQLGQFGRNRTNIWQYAGIQTLSKQSDEGNLLALHPTIKPVAMVADAILDCTARGDIVLDSFLGSGTTLMAAERVGRVCYGIEIDPLYVDVAIRRWQKQTGDFAIHSVTGMRFDDIVSKSEVQLA